jgi:isoleucyl-tRNA synthetase
MYVSAPRSRARRSGQTALYEILQALLRLMAPVLSFTADEVWGSMRHRPGEPGSVHLTEFPPVREDLRDEGLARRWEQLLAVRDVALKRLEEARKEKVIGTSLEAVAEVRAAPPLLDLLARHRDDLTAIFITSGVSVVPAAEGDLEPDAKVAVLVRRAPGAKCERCWNYLDSVGRDARHPSICHRCVAALDEAGLP